MGSLLLGLAGVVGACGGDAETSPPAPARAPLTYWQDVAPVLTARCLGCHQAGGIGPFRLDSFDQVKLRGALVANAVKNRTMPPWLANGDGSCGDFQGSMWLSEAEVQTIVRWVEEGGAEGTPRSDLALPTPATLGSTSTEVATPSYRPEPRGDSLAHADDYRCFLVDPKLDSSAGPQFLTGFEVVPGNPSLIHHVLLMQVQGGKPSGMVKGQASGRTNAELIAAMDAASPEEGWPCYGLAGEGVEVDGVPVTWAPGMGVVHYPARTGVPLTADTKLVMQVHYNLSSPSLRGRPDVTRIKLKMDAAVERVGFFDIQDEFLRTITTATPSTLAPGDKRQEYTWEIGYDQQMAALGIPYFEVHGVFPHMHAYGRSQRIEIVKGAGAPAACAVDVPRWDFNWQLYYFYKQPLRIQPGDKVRVTCSYDTTAAKAPVLPGWGTENEMCFMGLYLVPPGPN